jgi:hypothetical protein
MTFKSIAFSLFLGALAHQAWAVVPGGPAPVSAPTPAPRTPYQQYLPAPTKSPTPAADVARITIHGDSFSFVAQGGLAIPFGDYSTNYKTGGGGGVEAIYNSSSDMGFSIYAEYNSVPYSLTMVAQPFTSTGLGVRVLYEFYNLEDMKPFIEGGIGVYFVNRAAQSSDGSVQLVQGAGLGFNGGVGAIYYFNKKFGARAVINVTSVGLDGGTGENILYVGPSFGMIYTF